MPTGLLEQARQAYARQRWDAAYEGFTGAAAGTGLAVLEALATARFAFEHDLLRETT